MPSTLPADDGLERARRFRRNGALVTTGFCVVVVAAILGLLGVRSATVTEELSDGTTIELHYGRVTRPGLATPWTLSVSRPAGFDEPIVIRATSSYFAMFDENGLEPDPAASTQDGEEVIWEFDPPPGTTFSVSFDARIEPGVQWGRGGRAAIDLGDVGGEVSFHTWVLP